MSIVIQRNGVVKWRGKPVGNIERRNGWWAYSTPGKPGLHYFISLKTAREKLTVEFQKDERKPE